MNTNTLLTTVSFISMFFVSDQIVADDAPIDPIEEIIVTGVKTPGLELSKTAISASVLTSEQLEALRVESVTDLSKALPGLSVQRLGQVGGLFLTVRGIASNPFVVNRVAVYVDDVPYREMNELLLEDLASVEFLRGPQSSFYGLNPEAGAIVISTNKPGDEASGVLSASYHDYATSGGVWSGRATVSGPISEKVAGRLTVAGSKGDAYTRNFAAADGKEGEVEEIAIRGRLAFDLSERLSADLVLAYEKLNAPGLYEQEYLPLDLDVYNSTYADLYNSGVSIGRHELYHDNIKNTREENKSVSLRFRYEFDAFEFVAVTAYREEEDEAIGTELDLTALPLFRGADADTEKLFSQEIRLASNAGANVKWLLGATYFDEKDIQVLSTQNLAAGATDLTPASDQTKDGNDFALFGHTILPVSETFRVTLGARYEWSDRSSLQTEQVFELPTGPFITPAVDLEKSFSQFLPKIALDMDLGEDWLAYASASKGWLPGGFNLAAVSPSIDRDLVHYDSETLWNYELGIKGTLADGSARLSAAVFWIDAKNWQEFSIATTPDGAAASTSVVTSDSDVRSRGFEAEISWYPTEEIDFALAGSYTDVEYRKYDFAPGVSYSGNRPAYAPEFEVSARSEWRFAEGFAARIALSVQGNTQLNIENTAEQGTFALLDTSFVYETGPFTWTVFAKNLTNTHYFSGVAFDNFAFGRDGTKYAPVGAPRRIGLELAFKW